MTVWKGCRYAASILGTTALIYAFTWLLLGAFG